MYKGPTELFKKKLEESNSDRERKIFIFSFGDLEPVCEKLSGKKYGELKFISPELKNALSEFIKREEDINFTPLILEGFFTEDQTAEEEWESNVKFEFTDYAQFISIEKKVSLWISKERS